MDDILIVTAKQSEAAILWANYLKTRFDKITKQRGRIPFNFLHVKLDESPVSSDIVQRCVGTKLQIVIVCSALLKLPQAVLLNQLSNILRPDKVLSLLLEVTEEEVFAVHKKCLPSYKLWKRCVVQTQDQNFVGHVLGLATDILGPALRDQPLATAVLQQQQQHTTTTMQRQGSTEGFTLMPKKVKIGQSKVIVILNEPVHRDDSIHVRIDKTGEFLNVPIVKRRNPYTLQFSVPAECMEVSMMVDVHVEKNTVALGCRPLKCESRLRELEQILKSPDAPMEFLCQSMGVAIQEANKLDSMMLQAFQKNIPPNFHLLASTSDMAHNDGGGGGGGSTANCPLAQRESSPEEYPTLLHFSSRFGLERLTMQLLECPGGETAISIRNINGSTPLDLAELNKHAKCVELLKNFSQMHEFTTMYHYFKGVSGSASTNKVIVDLQCEITKQSSNSTTSGGGAPLQSPTMTIKRIPEYMEMNCSNSGSSGEPEAAGCPINAVSNLNYINVESNGMDGADVCDGVHSLRITEPETTNELKINEPAYYESKDANNADTFSVECSKRLDCVERAASRLFVQTPPPPPAPSQPPSEEAMSDYLIQPSNRPVTLNGFGDYLTHPSNKPICSSDSAYMNDEIRATTTTADNKAEGSHMKLSFGRKEKRVADEETASLYPGGRANTLKRQGSTTSKVSVDDELLEIINDFKNNVFTINEVEQLVSTWKNRNDVQQSFKDKQLQLQQMREEYERLQHQMKERMKRPTPFERMKKLFSRQKSTEEKDGAANPSGSSQRPASSLSLHSVSSSSSCGRLSTGSACSGTSLGDSGTHSDHDERRNTFSSNCRVGTPGSLLFDNYVVPPTPRPIVTPATTPTPNEERFSSGSSEHYIMFPSNAPVYQPDYVNFNNSLNTIDENKETDIAATIHPIKIQKPQADVIYAPVLRKPNPCSSFRNNATGMTVGGSHDSQTRCLEHNHFHGGRLDEDDDVIRNQLQEHFVKSIREEKAISRQNSSDDGNNHEQEEHSYRNI